MAFRYTLSAALKKFEAEVVPELDRDECEKLLGVLREMYTAFEAKTKELESVDPEKLEKLALGELLSPRTHTKKKTGPLKKRERSEDTGAEKKNKWWEHYPIVARVDRIAQEDPFELVLHVKEAGRGQRKPVERRVGAHELKEMLQNQKTRTTFDKAFEEFDGNRELVLSILSK
jgi:hypothetical protein